MKSILGIGNALTDILAVLPDDTLLRKYHLPLGSMQHVDMETGDRIWAFEWTGLSSYASTELIYGDDIIDPRTL